MIFFQYTCQTRRVNTIPKGIRKKEETIGEVRIRRRMLMPTRKMVVLEGTTSRNIKLRFFAIFVG